MKNSDYVSCCCSTMIKTLKKNCPPPLPSLFLFRQEPNFLRFQVKLRKVSAGPLSVWSIGADFSPYIYVPKTDIPVRTVVETWENQVGLKNFLASASKPFNVHCSVGTHLLGSIHFYSQLTGLVGQVRMEVFINPEKVSLFHLRAGRGNNFG